MIQREEIQLLLILTEGETSVSCLANKHETSHEMIQGPQIIRELNLQLVLYWVTGLDCLVLYSHSNSNARKKWQFTWVFSFSLTCLWNEWWEDFLLHIWLSSPRHVYGEESKCHKHVTRTRDKSCEWILLSWLVVKNKSQEPSHFKSLFELFTHDLPFFYRQSGFVLSDKIQTRVFINEVHLQDMMSWCRVVLWK